MPDKNAPPGGLGRAATAMPVIEGALAFIVISFVAAVWENIPVAHHRDAFVVVYASGAHFIFSFGIAAPSLALSHWLRSRAASAALMLGLFAYVFWSLILQHRGLANLLLEERWTIPMPYADTASSLLERAMGSGEFAFYLGPLMFSYALAAAGMLVLWVPSLLGGQRR
jgi:hypothetical protein